MKKESVTEEEHGIVSCWLPMSVKNRLQEIAKEKGFGPLASLVRFVLTEAVAKDYIEQKWIKEAKGD